MTVILALLALAAPTCAAPVRGSAPAILAGLAPRWREVAARAGIEVEFPPPFGPPQGTLDPRLEDFLEGRRDVALLTREVAEADLATYRAHHGGRAPVVIPVAAGAWDRFGYVDAVAVIVNHANPVRSLSLRQLDALWSQTRRRGGAPVRRWGDVGLAGGWRDRAIAVVGSGAWTGEESARALTIRRHVLSVGDRAGTWRAVAASGGEAEVVARVAADPAAIGFTGMGHLSPGVRAVPIAVDGKAVALTAASAASGRYPLLRTVDLLVATDAAGAMPPGVAALVRLLVAPAGQRVVAAQGDLAPLPPPALRRARAAASALRPGPCVIDRTAPSAAGRR